MSLRVLIYTKSGCPWCERAKEWLDDHMIEWEAIKLDDFGDRQEMYDRLGLIGKHRTVPQIIVNDQDGNFVEHIKGYVDLVESGLENRASAVL